MDVAYAYRASDATEKYGRNTAYNKRNEILFSVFNPRFPEWDGFRGAQYDGRPTHDPLAQNLAMNMLRKSILHDLPHTVLLRIAFLAASGHGLVSPNTPLYAHVCSPDNDGRRLLAAANLALQLRRLLALLPPDHALGREYRAWTGRVAKSLDFPAKREYAEMCPRDKTDKRYTTVNRLFVFGGEGGPDPATKRPAYIPCPQTFAEWHKTANDECSSTRIMNATEQVAKNNERTAHALQRYVQTGRKRLKCEYKLNHSNSTSLALSTAKWMQMLHFNKTAAETGARIYAALMRLGLSGAERDWVAFITPDTHDNTPDEDE